MAQGKKAGRQAGRQAHRAPDGPAEAPSTGIAPILVALGSLGLLLAVIGSGFLAITHVANITPPGCGPGSGCDEATRSAWGSIPGLGWPTSHLGLAFFVALAVGWFAAVRSGISPALRWLVRAGAVVSVMLVLVMLVNGYLCRYCLLAHAGNLLFWVSLELASRQSSTVAAATPIKAAVSVFIFATLLLIPVEVIARGQAEEKAAEELDQDISRIVAAADETRTSDPVDRSGEVFTGRYLLGPEKAAIRIVAFTDYQCPDCRKFETELRGIMDQRDDISLSIKQFPMSSKCNPYMPRDMHANACMAARAAEAAGIIGGEDAFWKMHFWLFDQGGEFTDATFSNDLRAMGYDPRAFIDIMLSQQTLELVREDIDEGVDLGLFFTPMVFINGVELRNPHFQGTITNAIARLDTQNLQAMSASEAGDTPPNAAQKYVDDWAIGRSFDMPPDEYPNVMGDADPVLDIVVWGDYAEINTMTVDRLIRQRMAVQNGIRYHFRHFPMDQSCNSFATRTAHTNACIAAQAVEAAGLLGGEQAWWDMHATLFANYMQIDESLIRHTARELGLDVDRLMIFLNSADANDAIQDDAMASKRVGLDRVPYIFINGKKLNRITMKGELAIGHIFDAELGKLTRIQQQQMRSADLGGLGMVNVRYDDNTTPSAP